MVQRAIGWARIVAEHPIASAVGTSSAALIGCSFVDGEAVLPLVRMAFRAEGL